MSNPQLNFRLHREQIARGIQYILALEPRQPPLSASVLVKTIYLDTLAKADFKHREMISSAIYATADALISNKDQIDTAWAKASFQAVENLTAMQHAVAQQSTVQQTVQPVAQQPPVVTQPPIAQPPAQPDMNEMFASFVQFQQAQAQAQSIEVPELTAKERITAREDEIFNQAKAKAVQDAEQEEQAEQEIKRDAEIDADIALATQHRNSHLPKASDYDTSGEYETESEINTVTDFSPPTDWKEQE